MYSAAKNYVFIIQLKTIKDGQLLSDKSAGY